MSVDSRPDSEALWSKTSNEIERLHAESRAALRTLRHMENGDAVLDHLFRQVQQVSRAADRVELYELDGDTLVEFETGDTPHEHRVHIVGSRFETAVLEDRRVQASADGSQFSNGSACFLASGVEMKRSR